MKSLSVRAALKIYPDQHPLQNNLAWLLATHPDDEIRDGAEALRLATELVEQVDSESPLYLDLLAAAQAECGRFAEAVATAHEAAQRARATDRQELAEKIQDRLVNNYQQDKPFREPLPKTK